MVDPFFLKIEARCKEIGLPPSMLAQKAGFYPVNASKWRRGKRGPHEAARTKLIDTLEAEEIRLRDYLLHLHPVVDEPLGDESEVR